MKKFFLVVAGIVTGAIIGVAIFFTAIFIREKSINNQSYIP